MDPANNAQSSSFGIPVSPTPQQPVSIASPGAMPPAPPAGAPVLGGNNGQPAPAAMATPIIASEPLAVAASTTNVVVPQTADDSDLIEPEWVDKAKRIVQSNLENPYEQSRELTSLKAEYMKKRYNKDIRLGE